VIQFAIQHAGGRESVGSRDQVIVREPVDRYYRSFLAVRRLTVGIVASPPFERGSDERSRVLEPKELLERYASGERDFRTANLSGADLRLA
jgi:hypothetical protein